MSYRVEINRKVAKSIEKLPKKEITKLLDKITELGENPYPVGSKKLVGASENVLRIRQGNYRIIYVVEEEVKLVEIRKIGHRRDVYL